MASSKLYIGFLVLCIVQVHRVNCGVTGAIGAVGGKAVVAVATPVEETIVKTALNNCEPVKKILGVRYKDLKGDIDTSALALDFYGGSIVDDMIRFGLKDSATRAFKTGEVDINAPVYFFLHGFLSSSKSDAALEVVRALKTAGAKNVFALDSSSLISFFYLRSSSVVEIIGQQLGGTLTNLVKAGVKPENIHVIGHSLGSHIAGFAGKTFTKKTGKKIGRISGLDPAGPCFFQKNPELRLHSGDALFVDAIHTDAGIFGIIDPLGDVDFFPNSGSEQPSCVLPPCSHTRAWELYAQSILGPKRFASRKCVGKDTYISGGCDNNELNHMGFGADPSKPGVFYLKTAGKAPFDIDEQTPKDKGQLGRVPNPVKALKDIF